MIRLKKLYTQVKQEDGPEVVFIDEKSALMSSLEEVILATHHIFCVWHVNKNFQA